MDAVNKSIFDKKISSENLFQENSLRGSLLREVIQKAVETDASDIHLEALSKSYAVRFRVDGKMVIFKRDLESRIAKKIVDLIKSMSAMDLTKRDIVQDGAFSIDSISRRFRVSISPTKLGESIVLRTINDEHPKVLEDLGHEQKFCDAARAAIKEKKGLIIVTGPTGSGKSSTVHTLLYELDPWSKKIISIENPVERLVDGVCQKEITRKVSWSDAMKNTLREDPDVIFVGEIRDKESANLAIQASMTGHLVMGTMHTNSAEEVKERLNQLGVESYCLEKVLLMAVSQTLVPVPCECEKGCGVCRKRGTPGFLGRRPKVDFIRY